MKPIAASVLVLVAIGLFISDSLRAESFLRGDSNSDGNTDISDGTIILRYLFQGTAEPPCLDAADVNDSGGLNLSDPIYLLNYLFLGGAELPAPSLICGEDPTADGLGCLTQSEDCQQGIPGFSYEGENAAGYEEYLHGQTRILFIRIPGGQSTMGSPPEEIGRDGDEGPVHSVTLSPYLIAKYEVTQAQYEAVMGFNPGFFQFDWVGDGQGSADLPVDLVSWDALNADSGFLARTGLELPTETQWEFAARGGARTAFHFGNQASRLGKFAWFEGNSGGLKHRVGLKAPNQFGLYDMHGNAWEWTKDGYSDTFYADPAASELDPVVNLEDLSFDARAVTCRGGSFRSGTDGCRSSQRDGSMPTTFSYRGLGFRLAYSLSQGQ